MQFQSNYKHLIDKNTNDILTKEPLLPETPLSPTTKFLNGNKAWADVSNILGYTPENVENKKVSFQETPSDTAYVSEKLVKDSLDLKVDKVTGKQLSTEDYTTLEQSKLSGIADNANNYTHPANHPASIITQDLNNRFVTDIEKSTWNGKDDVKSSYDSNWVTISNNFANTTLTFNHNLNTTFTRLFIDLYWKDTSDKIFRLGDFLVDVYGASTGYEIEFVTDNQIKIKLAESGVWTPTGKIINGNYRIFIIQR
jgi:hypothetical protein